MTKTLARSVLPRQLLTRLLEEPEAVGIVQSLEAPVLTKLIHHVGLEDSAELIALASTEQLKQIFDEDLWKSERPGQDESFDADRFGLWLEVMLEVGEAFAARKLTELDEDLVTLALCKQVLVVDADDLASQLSDSDRSSDDDLLDKALESCLYQEFGEYQVIARNHESFDAIVAILLEIDKEDHSFLHRLLDRCCNISNEFIEENGGLYDVLTSEDMLEEDLAGEREERREREGYVGKSSAASFLGLPRVTPLEQIVGARTWDPVTRSYFRAAAAVSARGSGADRRSVGQGNDTRQTPGTVKFLQALRDAEVIETPRQTGLLGEGAPAHDLPFTQAITALRNDDPALYAQRLLELSYLSNVLISGCSFEGRSFRPFEAIEAAISACNLGLEHLSVGGSGEEAARSQVQAKVRKLVAEIDAVKSFSIGWHLWHGESMRAAETLEAVLAARAKVAGDPQVASELKRVASHLKANRAAGKPWLSRGKLGAARRVLGPRLVAGLKLLLSECPALPSFVRDEEAGKPARGAGFIATVQRLHAIRRFLKQFETKGFDAPLEGDVRAAAEPAQPKADRASGGRSKVPRSPERPTAKRSGRAR